MCENVNNRPIIIQRTMQRIFLAVDISETARDRASDYINGLKEDGNRSGISWVRPEKLHLTLRFVGDCGAHEADMITAIAGEIATEIESFRISISGTGVFPSEKKARVIWLGVDGDVDRMRRAKDLFEEKYASRGQQENRDPLTPHLTIGRVKDPSRARGVVERHLEAEFEPVDFTVAELVVYESKLLPTGSVYTAVSRHRLGTVI
jgi:RNA 2',3'-cyclic 3'-phosphodiesterase